MYKELLTYLPPIHKEGFIFIGVFLTATILIFHISDFLGIIGLILTLWCVCFFRDPARITPIADDIIISPADGLVTSIGKAKAPVELGFGDEERTRISIFLSIFDVHVNRLPVSGKVKALHYHPGKFISATLDKSSDLNERQSILIEDKAGREYGVVQIAGLLARRIVCDLDESQEVKAGERFGIIRFGSRVDLYLPKNVVPAVGLGQYMLGGETIIAKQVTKGEGSPTVTFEKN